MSNIKYIIPLGPALISNPSSNTDGYGLQIVQRANYPALYIDSATASGAKVEFSEDGYVVAPRGNLVLQGDNILHDGPISFNPDNIHDIGQSDANRPRNVYIGSQVVVGNTITINTNTIAGSGSLLFQAPGDNTIGGPEGYSFMFDVTGQRTLLTPLDQSVFTIRNLNRNILRVDGYGSIHLGDTSDGYGLDASRLVFNPNRYGSASAPSDGDDAGFFVERGSTVRPAKLFWDEEDDIWKADVGDGVERDIVPIPLTLTDSYQTVCQDGGESEITIINAFGRGIVHRVIVDTSCPLYDFAIYDEDSFSDPLFEQTGLSGVFTYKLPIFYEEQDGYSEFHYKITNNDTVAHTFDSYIRIESFFTGRDQGFILENFDDDDIFCGPISAFLLDEDFDSYGGGIFDPEAYTLGLLDESFDAYGVFDGYAGAILASNDMNSLGF
jgi:hypothetical protein